MTRTSRARPNAPRRDPASAMLSVRRQLDDVVQSSNDAIFQRTVDGVITTWNAAAERILGFQADQIVGRSSRVLLPRGQRDEFDTLLGRVRRGELVEPYETAWRRKDGRRIHVSVTLSPVRDSRQRLVGFSTIARDVTEARRIKELLARREHELQDLFDEASVGLVLLARDGTILRANHALFELLDGRPEEIIGRSLREFHPDPRWVETSVARLASRQTLHNVPAELRTGAGAPRHVLVDANALWQAGRFVHSRWFVRDISRRRQLERELLELSERERRGFAQELHDGLGQQLGGVAYLSNVLREKLADRAAPEAAAADRIFGLVRDAIEQTRRLARGLSPIRPEPDGLMTALRELARQTTELFRVRCHYWCRQPVLTADATLAGHLFRIAQEAVSNALKHGKPDGITIRLSRRRDRILLGVSDNGAGMGTLSPTRHGLGLHIMQYRAGLLRGTLTVRPRRGGGTEVLCTAPSDEANPPERTKRT